MAANVTIKRMAADVAELERKLLPRKAVACFNFPDGEDSEPYWQRHLEKHPKDAEAELVVGIRIFSEVRP